MASSMEQNVTFRFLYLREKLVSHATTRVIAAVTEPE